MTLEEAIKELANLYQVGLNRLTPDEKKAVKLGEEALKRWQKHRQEFMAWQHDFLPSETTE